jgi:hypothetical protein
MATAKQSTAKSTTPRRAATKKAEPVKVTATKRATTRKPAPKAEPKADQGSVTGTFSLARLPKGGGGVRYEVENDREFSPVYLSQEDYAAMGEPQRIRATYTAI